MAFSLFCKFYCNKKEVIAKQGIPPGGSQWLKQHLELVRHRLTLWSFIEDAEFSRLEGIYPPVVSAS